MNSHYIPKFLGSQPQFLWWELDEAMILISFLVAGRLIDKTLIFLTVGVIIKVIYSKLKNSKQQGYLLHKLYALGLMKPKSNTVKKNKIPFFYIKLYVK